MSLTREEIQELVITSLREVLKDKTVREIDEATDPINDLGLDSLDGINFACTLSEKLKINIPHELNPLLDDEKNRPRRVGEIIDLLNIFLKKQQEASHG